MLFSGPLNDLHVLLSANPGMPKAWCFLLEKFRDGNKKWEKNDAIDAIIDSQLLCVCLGGEENPFLLLPIYVALQQICSWESWPALCRWKCSLFRFRFHLWKTPHSLHIPFTEQLLPDHVALLLSCSPA